MAAAYCNIDVFKMTRNEYSKEGEKKVYYTAITSVERAAAFCSEAAFEAYLKDPSRTDFTFTFSARNNSITINIDV